jgi:gliding motility-associated-like protein
MKKLRFILLIMASLFFKSTCINAQGFTSGTIPMCDTSDFTWYNPFPSVIGNNGTQINYIKLNITSNHPGTLKVLLISPNGISLTLSAFHGAGGQNYTGCIFVPSAAPNITTGTAPFTGNWLPEGSGGFSVFNGISAKGTWTIRIIDTLCNPTLYPGGGVLTNGYFNGSGAGGFAIFNCSYTMLTDYVTICPGQTFNAATYYQGYFSVSINNSNQLILSQPGFYSVYLEDYGGCDYYGTLVLGNYPSPTLGSDQTINICNGNYLNLDSIINNNSITKNWTQNGIPISAVAASTVTQSGIYQLTATNTYGCSSTQTFTVNTTTGLNIGIDQNLTNCPGQSVNLNTLYNTIGLTTNWYNNGILISNPSNVYNPGIYTIIAINSFGCIDTANINLSTNTTNNLGPDQSVSICSGTTLNLTTLINLQGANIVWRKGNTIILSPTNITAGGIYTAIATYSSGCKDTATITVTVNQNNSLGNNVNLLVCNNQPIDLTAYFNPPFNTHNWYFNSSIITNITSVTDTGLYTIIATDTNGCLDSASVKINHKPSPNLGNDQTISGCFIGTVNLDSLFNLSNYTYIWKLGTTVINNSTAISTNGTYTIMVTNTYGCTDFAKVIVNINPTPSLGNDKSITICEQNTTNLNNLFTAGTNSINWYYNNTLQNSVSAVSDSGLYTITATNSFGCIDTANVILSLFPKPNLGNDLNINVCSNFTEDLNSYFNTASYNVSWEYNGNAIANPTSVNTSGNYSLYVIDNNGCKDTVSVILNQLSPPQLGSDLSETICSDSSIDLNALINTANLSSNWIYNSTVVANPSNVNSPGTYNLIATNSDGCSDTVNVSLAVNPIPNPGPVQTLSVCQGQSLNLNSYFNITNETVLWSHNGQVIQDVTAIQDSGTYNLQLTNSNGCNAKSSANLNILPKPEIGPSTTLTNCNGTTTNLTTIYNLNGLNSIWEYNGSQITNPIAVYQAGVYQVIANDQNGCGDTAQISLAYYAGPDLGPDMNYSLCTWQSLDLSSLYSIIGVTAQYFFNGNIISNYTSVNDSGQYQIVVTDINGCKDTMNITYSIVDCICSADFKYNSTCIDDPIQFEILADSTILNSHWQFSQQGISDSYENNPSILLQKPTELTVTVAVTLSCGIDTITKTINFENCFKKCKLFIPSAFSPNKDGINDSFKTESYCEPEYFRMRILNRLGKIVFSSDDFNKTWDGTIEGTVQAEGIYLYIIEYEFPNQLRSVEKNTFTLLR